MDDWLRRIGKGKVEANRELEPSEIKNPSLGRATIAESRVSRKEQDCKHNPREAEGEGEWAEEEELAFGGEECGRKEANEDER